MPDTCDRCHRQKGVPAPFDRHSPVCAYTDGMAWDSVAGVDCTEARERWLVARVAKLEAQLAAAAGAPQVIEPPLAQPRWRWVPTVDGQPCRRLMRGAEKLAEVSYWSRDEAPWRWMRKETGGFCRSVEEAMTAAEKACGMEVPK